MFVYTSQVILTLYVAGAPILSGSNPMRVPLKAEDSGVQSRPLLLRDQGSFAAGGTVIKNSGRFNPLKMTPDGQTLHGDHAYVQYQIPTNARRIPSSFCTVPGSSRSAGGPRRTDVTISRASSCDGDSAYTSSISPAGAVRGSARCPPVSPQQQTISTGSPCSGSASGRTSFRGSGFPAIWNP
jgi:hypothetical protein